MPLDDPVQAYKVLEKRPCKEKALEILKKVASQIKPVLEKRRWKVKNLCEFFPTNPNLLGCNVNRGWKINLRLRPHYDDSQFLEYNDILGTMLHEVAHIVRGPHDEQFYKLLEELKTETELLMASGYRGEGFQSEGHRLGSSSSNPVNSRAAVAEAAKRREKMSRIMIPTGGVRLGGEFDQKASPAQMAARAAQKRLEDNIWCGGSQTIVIEDNEDEPPISTKRKTQTDHSSAPKRSRTTSDEWKCLTCTFENKPLALICQICLCMKPIDNITNDLWQCPQCTLLNQKKWQTCTACSFVHHH